MSSTKPPEKEHPHAQGGTTPALSPILRPFFAALGIGDVSAKSAAGEIRKLRGRQREVGEYLLRASQGRLNKLERGVWSLNFIIYWLRDHAADVAWPMSVALMKAVVNGSMPLTNVTNHLKGTPLERYVEALRSAGDVDTSALEQITYQGCRVAINRSPINLAQFAFREGADIYVASSPRGAVITARIGWATLQGPDGWTQPYPNMLIPPPGMSAEEILKRVNIQRKEASDGVPV